MVDRDKLGKKTSLIKAERGTVLKDHIGENAFLCPPSRAAGGYELTENPCPFLL